jgi:hypothetical protein
LNSIKDLKSQSEEIRFGKIQGAHGGKPYYALNEAQVTAVKMNLRKNSEVISQPKTELEKELIVQQALVCQQEKINTLTKRLAIAEPKAETLDRITATGSDISKERSAPVSASRPILKLVTTIKIYPIMRDYIIIRHQALGASAAFPKMPYNLPSGTAMRFSCPGW